MSTATQLATRAAVRFRDPNNAVIAATSWLSYLNEAYNRVNSASPYWPWLETSEQTISVTAAARSASLPTDVLAVNWVYNVTDDYPLVAQEGRGDFFHQGFLRSDTGQPTTYRLRGSTIELNPIPEATTSLRAECMLMPTALAADTVTGGSATGGAAGDITITGIAVGDTLLSVTTVLNASPYTTADLTSEFSITAANTINNSAGTATTSKRVVATYRTASTSAEPVFPEAFHDILIDGALAAAYLDDGNAKAGGAHEAVFASKLKDMLNSIQAARTENYVPVRDVF